MRNRKIAHTPRLSALLLVPLLLELCPMSAPAQAVVADSVAGTPATVDSLSGDAAPNPRYVAPPGSHAAPKRPKSWGRMGLEVGGAELLIALNAGLAAGSPLGYGIIFVLLSPLAATQGPSMGRTEKIVTLATFESIGVYNLVMAATGEHSEETVFNGNMIAWNAALIGTWATHKTIFKKDKAPQGGGSGEKAWSTDVAIVGNNPGFVVRYRF